MDGGVRNDKLGICQRRGSCISGNDEIGGWVESKRQRKEEGESKNQRIKTECGSRTLITN